MRLKEGLKKEDLTGEAFKINSIEESDAIQKFLFELGFEWWDGDNSLHAFRDGYILIDDDKDAKVMWWNKNGLNITNPKSLSDLVEEEHPEYVRCVNWIGNKFIPGKIYPVKGRIIYGEEMFKDVPSDYKIYGHQFTPATKEEYESQNTYTGYATEALAEQAKEWDEQHPSKEKYEISIEQLEQIRNVFTAYGGYKAVEILKEWFPNASIFKEKEPCYKLGQVFMTTQGKVEQFTLNECSCDKVALHSYDGKMLNMKSAIVKDINCIPLSALEHIQPDFLKHFATV